MVSLDEIDLDLAELKSLRAQAIRPHNQTYLDNKIAELKNKAEQEKKAKTTPTATTVTTKPTTVLIPTIKLTNYALDQSDKFVKLYYPLKGISSHAADKIVSKFAKFECDISINEFNGKNYIIVMKGLLDEIIPESCQIKQKSDDLLIMLRKKTEGKTWGALTKAEFDEKEKNKPKLDNMNDDPQASLMNMMKEMYDTGDDEMKRNIRKAWHEGQNKKNTADFPM